MNPENIKYKIWFFGGGEARDNKFNLFTGSFIRLMKEIMGDEFDFIKGIYFSSNMINVIWTLNNCQRPLKNPDKQRLINIAATQILTEGYNPEMQLVLVGSSTGSTVAAQTAVYLAQQNRERLHFRRSIHLGLGSTVISKESALYRKLLEYQKEGCIGTIVFDDLQDEDDSANSSGGTTRMEAYANAFGLMFPFFSRKFSGPSFLNTHPEKGHIHRRRSQTLQKALDYIDMLLIKNNLAGDKYRDKARALIERESAAG
jgi:hypothetical protein